MRKPSGFYLRLNFGLVSSHYRQAFIFFVIKQRLFEKNIFLDPEIIISHLSFLLRNLAVLKKILMFQQLRDTALTVDIRASPDSLNTL